MIIAWHTIVLTVHIDTEKNKNVLKERVVVYGKENSKK